MNKMNYGNSMYCLKYEDDNSSQLAKESDL